MIDFVYYCGLLVVFSAYIGAVYLAFKGSAFARHFLWIWSIALVVINSQMPTSMALPWYVGLLSVGFFLYSIYWLFYTSTNVGGDASQADIRRLNAVSAKRVDEILKGIYRRLHDDINPHILNARNAIRLVIKSPEIQSNEKLIASLELIVASLQEAYDVSRSMSQDTRMELIDSIGFTGALESLVDHYRVLFPQPRITLSHNLPLKPEIDPETALSAFRIIREAIYNCIKHAKSENLNVTVLYGKALNEYSVQIRDDGVGLRDTFKSSVDGIGLLDMRERAYAMGSELKIQPQYPKNDSRPGTSVSFSFSGLSPEESR